MGIDRRSKLAAGGFTVTEVVVAMILLGAVLAVIVPFGRRAAEQGRRSATRRAALLEVSNALERVSAEAVAPPGEVREIPVPESLARRVPEPRLTVTAVLLSDPPGRRFDAELTWLAPTGGRTAPIRLSAFAFDSPDVRGDAP